MTSPAAVIGAAGAALVMSLGILTVVVTTDAAAVQCLPADVAVTGTIPTDMGLDPAQAANATTIVRAVVAERVPSRAAVIAVATALQESSLHNLASHAVPESLTFPHDGVAAGDHDSVGLFQQRANWGTVAQRMAPSTATGAFLDHLQQVSGWELLPVAQAAQAVQASATPDAYAMWELEASRIVNGLLGRAVDAGDSNQTAGDAPGLYAEGDGLLAAVQPSLPITYNGGAVTAAVATGRTTTQGIADLTAHDATLPGALLISLGASDHITAATADTFRAQVTAVLAMHGGDRTVYWLTALGAAPMNGVLRDIAATDPDLQLVDVDQALHTHPSWLDGTALSPAGVDGASQLVLTALGANTQGDPTASTVSSGGCADGLGGYSSIAVADCSFAVVHTPPRTCADAIRWALAQQDGDPQWYRRCLNFVARAYGLPGSGVGAPYTAREFWIESNSKHAGDLNPPAGALVFWNGGSAGHVALSAGNRMVISNDIRGNGTIALVPLDEITTRWNDPYLGWTQPDFASAA